MVKYPLGAQSYKMGLSDTAQLRHAYKADLLYMCCGYMRPEVAGATGCQRHPKSKNFKSRRNSRTHLQGESGQAPNRKRREEEAERATRAKANGVLWSGARLRDDFNWNFGLRGSISCPLR